MSYTKLDDLWEQRHRNVILFSRTKYKGVNLGLLARISSAGNSKSHLLEKAKIGEIVHCSCKKSQMLAYNISGKLVS